MLVFHHADSYCADIAEDMADIGIDVAGVTEEEIRDEARRVYETYGPGGFFIPSFTYGDLFSIYPGVYDAFSNALAELNRSRR